MSIIQLKNVSYVYKESERTRVLSDVSCAFERGKFYAIVGESGSGKTTLLSLLAGLDEPTEGQIIFEDKDIKEIGYTYYRKNDITIVFQNYNLLDYLTPLENIQLVKQEADKSILLNLGLKEEQINRNVLHLSGGQQQRVAIARALVSGAPLVLADEPTGNLDENTSDDIIQLLKATAHQENKCVIVVTHSKQLSDQADVVYRLKGMKLTQV
ncbi:ABC transporter ATP-binding protein [Aerococcaceae bacterium zg-ZJ1578]|uniref:ABC transporter ATP-binding protein n=1 Tax=Aerococcaceae TaxID=186827 RepID=UPI0013BCF79A|nr:MULTISPECIES: ABC transporter ATP-binding protein [unclassified Facklamia]MBK0347919.1 ABC transporter ATP-binding protein [Aerococcaceae bacterium zg-1578]MBR7928290.1 ABC transporter ATP-binding protein [Aerococcaceae bacterium zg-ZUI334]MBS4461091.1 ABC transporter ATP-binding protein [Aerococcaceae bacterium zg-B36]QQD64879.1 ABC transporter ATP-binding protein [Aerococcaceae bacterium zg-252]NEW64420.1 ATP-binding cassette domain-containing protein [Facklamia sp. 252]